MIYTLSLNPAVDKTYEIPNFTLGALNRAVRVRADAAGKAVNVAKALCALGEPCVAMGILGGESGKSIEKHLKELGAETNFIEVVAPTRVNLKVVDPNSGLVTEINEPGSPVRPETLALAAQKLEARLKAGDIAVLSGALPPGADASIYEKLVKLCARCGAKAFVDADGEALKLAVNASPYAVKPNRHELGAFLGRQVYGMEDCLHGAHALIGAGVTLAVITLGEDGALFMRGKERLYAQGLKIQARSTVGAGDAVMAALALGEARGMGLLQTARLCMAAGAASTLNAGSQGPGKDDIAALLDKVTVETV